MKENVQSFVVWLTLVVLFSFVGVGLTYFLRCVIVFLGSHQRNDIASLDVVGAGTRGSPARNVIPV